MIHFMLNQSISDIYHDWLAENNKQDSTSSVLEFLIENGYLFAVKTSNVIDGTNNSSKLIKEDTFMANNEVKDLEKNGTGTAVETTESTKKEFFLKRWVKGAWHGICKVGRAVKESPATHIVMTGVGVAGTLAVEEIVRRKLNKSDDGYEQDEPIEIEDTGEVIDEVEPEEVDEVTE